MVGRGVPMSHTFQSLWSKNQLHVNIGATKSLFCARMGGNFQSGCSQSETVLVYQANQG